MTEADVVNVTTVDVVDAKKLVKQDEEEIEGGEYMTSHKKSQAAKKGWRKRKKRYGKNGVKG